MNKIYIGKCFSLLLILLLTACVPYPRTVHVAPEIKGQFLASQDNVSQWRVKYSDAVGSVDACRSPKVSSKIAQDGTFKFQGRTEHSLTFPLLPVHGAYQWSLCFENATTRAQHRWKASSYGPLYSPEKLELVCDIVGGFSETSDVPSSFKRSKLCKFVDLKTAAR